ncbi:MAG TPA: cupin domain-containing protein [Anaerolineaceae bacterium]|nr:cupin domain-containing protein [Anaerolineaceae bacterium]
MSALITEDELRRRVRQEGLRRLALAPGEVITPAALEAAAELGVLVQRPGDVSAPIRNLPPLKAVRRADIRLKPFGEGLATSGTDVRLQDVVCSTDGSPMAAGYMSLERGSFPWTLEYDEVDVVLEGELVIRRGTEVVRAGPGDCTFIPKGSAITFETPSFVRFVYVTYPADWGGTP